ncbi:hypothetical protein PFISCL1PPCAC_21870, partial [Pristionchus fissidentatus]
ILKTPIRHIIDRLREVYSKCEIGTLIVRIDYDVQIYHDLIDCLVAIRCTTGASITGRLNLISNQILRELISNKNMLEIMGLKDRINASGILTIWEDLLDGKFEGLNIMNVKKSVLNEVFEKLGYERKNKQFEEEQQIECTGRVDKSKRYEIWSDRYERTLTMSRIYEGRMWMSRKYE